MHVDIKIPITDRWLKMKRFFEDMGSIFVLMAVLGLVFQTPVCEAAGAIVSLISDESLGPAARHGLEKVKAALREKGAQLVEAANPATARGGMLLVAGLAKGPGTAADLVREQALAPPNGPEALLIRRLEWEGKEVFLVCGSDDRGLMYGLLDAADRIGWAESAARPLNEIRDASEKPYTPERALSMYTMHRATFESFFYDESFWERYLDMLARNRYNTFALIFGYENYGYFVPHYPHFYNMDEFPEVRLVGITEAGQERNRKALRRVIAMAHERGLNFTLGIWDHIYRGNYGHTLTEPTPGFVWGLTGENLMEYSVAALRRFLKTFPEIDAIQFRMHGESGLKKGEMEEFWTRMYQTMIDHAPQMRFDARAKNSSPS